MTRDPFDELRKMIKEAMKEGNAFSSATGKSISIRKTGDETEIEVKGDISEEEIEQLKRKHPNANIIVNGEEYTETSPVELIDEESSEKTEQKQTEESETDEIPPEKLALERYKEEEKEEKEK